MPINISTHSTSGSIGLLLDNLAVYAAYNAYDNCSFVGYINAAVDANLFAFLIKFRAGLIAVNVLV